MLGVSTQKLVGSGAAAVAVVFTLYHPRSPFVQKRRELGRKEEAAPEITAQLVSDAFIGYAILANSTAGFFPLTTPQDPLKLGLAMAALTTVLDLPHAVGERRNLQLFALNRVHDFAIVGTIAGLLKLFI